MTNKLRKILAIGGGEISSPREGGVGNYPPETKLIDREILRLTNSTSASLLFIPTASNDSESYFVTVKKHFLKIGFSSVNVLYLSDKALARSQIQQTILSHDAIYVGGGNTLKMMKVWRKLGVDKMLKQALDNGIVLSGLSAGSICWFNKGSSDSHKITGNHERLISVTGLGFIDAFHSPHFDVEPHRQSHIMQIMKHSSKVAICLDNCVALEVVGNEYRIIKSKANAKAYKVYWKNHKYYTEELVSNDLFSSIENLLSK
jgi:dipeptidase E